MLAEPPCPHRGGDGHVGAHSFFMPSPCRSRSADSPRINAMLRGVVRRNAIRHLGAHACNARGHLRTRKNRTACPRH